MAAKQIPSEREFQLLTLTFRERSGREVARLYEQGVGSSISYGTLYSTFKRLKEQGWVSVRNATDEDGRVRFFRITGKGQKAWAVARDRYAALLSFGKLFGAGAAG